MNSQQQQNAHQGQPQENHQNHQNNQNAQQLSEADKLVYQEIFKSINHIDKKVQNAKSKLHNKEVDTQQRKDMNYKQIAEKLIESKQNSQIVNKEDILTDINQSFQRAVIDVYSENQKLKKKMGLMQKIIREQHHKIFEQQTKQQDLIKEVEKLRLELAQVKDHNILQNRGVGKAQQQEIRKQTVKKGNTSKAQNNQNNEDYDFWNTPQNQNNIKKKKQFIENSGLWVNQKNIGDSMFITESRK